MVAFLVLFVTLGRLYRDMLKQPETRALLGLASLVLFVGVVFYVNVEHWSFINAVYFCVVTLGTVGYGDITPTTDAGKLFTVIYIIVGLGVIGGFFATLGRLIDPQRLLALRFTAPDLAKQIEELAKERERLTRLIQRAEASEPPPHDGGNPD
jgi:voltage-gated potassium channel